MKNESIITTGKTFYFIHFGHMYINKTTFMEPPTQGLHTGYAFVMV